VGVVESVISKISKRGKTGICERELLLVAVRED
jgi:hypothetical protein